MELLKVDPLFPKGERHQQLPQVDLPLSVRQTTMAQALPTARSLVLPIVVDVSK